MTLLSGPALLLLGMALGPHGLNVLTPSMMAFLDPAMAMGLAMLGVFVGLRVDPRRPGELTFFAIEGLRALATVLIVGTGILLASRIWSSPDAPAWLLALMLGLCAAAADSTALDRTNTEDFLVIVLGGAMVLIFRQTAPGLVMALVSGFAAVAVVIALAGRLLVDQTSSEREQHVFVLGSLLLLGGAAVYLSVSALLMGLIGGLIWNVTDNVARDRMTRDLQYLQHPLIVLLLLVAGARATPSLQALGLAIVYAVARVAGRSMTGSRPRREARVELSSAGLIGLALMLDVIHVVTLAAWTEIALATVVIGTMIAEVLARLVPERPYLGEPLVRGAAE
jgi:hypothetical protein